MTPRSLHLRRVLLAAIVGLLCAAPTPGDVGGCGQEAALLDAPTFFVNKKLTDCRRCDECGLITNACLEACDETVPFDRDFPDGCLPLVHDGEVCLRALRHASCDDYAGFVSDHAPTTPSECNFCPPRGDQ